MASKSERGIGASKEKKIRRRAVKEVIGPSRAEVEAQKQLQAYQAQLRNAGVPTPDVVRVTQAHPAKRVIDQDIRGLKMSRGAVAIAEGALEVGIDVAPIIDDAAAAAKSEGRNKIGPFGKGRAGEIFSRLQDRVNQIRARRSFGGEIVVFPRRPARATG